MSDAIPTKTIYQLAPLDRPLDGSEMIEVQRTDGSWHVPLPVPGDITPEAQEARDEAVAAAAAAETARDEAVPAAARAESARDAAVAAEGAAVPAAAQAVAARDAAQAAASDAQGHAAAATSAAGTASAARDEAVEAAGVATTAADSTAGSVEAAEAARDAAQAARDEALPAAAQAEAARDEAVPAAAIAATARDEAVGAAATATSAAAQAVAFATGEYGVFVMREAGIVDGGYPAARSVRLAVTLNRFFAEALGGDATVAVRVNDALVHGPVALTDGQRVTQAVSIVLAEGDTVTFDVVAGGAKRLWAQIDGGEA